MGAGGREGESVCSHEAQALRNPQRLDRPTSNYDLELALHSELLSELFLRAAFRLVLVEPPSLVILSLISLAHSSLCLRRYHCKKGGC